MVEISRLRDALMVCVALIIVSGILFNESGLNCITKYTETCWGTVDSVEPYGDSVRVYVVYTVDDGTDKTGTYKGNYLTDSAPSVGDAVLLMATPNYAYVKPFNEDTITSKDTKESAGDDGFVIKAFVVGVLVVVTLIIAISGAICFFVDRGSASTPYAHNEADEKLKEYLSDMRRMLHRCKNKAQRAEIFSTYKWMQKAYKDSHKLSELTVAGTEVKLKQLQENLCDIFGKIVDMTSSQLMDNIVCSTNTDLTRELEILKSINILSENGGNL